MAKKQSNKSKQIEASERFLILSDLDGTLLNNDSDVSAFTCKVVRKVVSYGHIFIIITGRPPQNALPIYKKLGLKHLMCNLNGSYIWNPSDKNFIPVNLCFNADIAIRILSSKKVLRYVDNFVVENYKGTYIRYIPKIKYKSAAFCSFHIRPHQTVVEVGDNLSKLEGVDCYSILLQVKDRSKETLNKLIFELRFFSSTLISRVWFDPNLGYVVEINTKFATKGTALDYLSNYYSIPKENCIAFGDGENDDEMLNAASYGYAMMNGSVTAKLAASYITKHTNDQDGVARTLDYIEKLIHRGITGNPKKSLIDAAEREERKK